MTDWQVYAGKLLLAADLPPMATRRALKAGAVDGAIDWRRVCEAIGREVTASAQEPAQEATE